MLIISAVLKCRLLLLADQCILNALFLQEWSRPVALVESQLHPMPAALDSALEFTGDSRTPKLEKPCLNGCIFPTNPTEEDVGFDSDGLSLPPRQSNRCWVYSF